MTIYFVVMDDGKTMMTEVLKAFTKIERAQSYMKKLAEENDLVYDKEYDSWRDTIEYDDYAVIYHIEPIQLEES